MFMRRAHDGPGAPASPPCHLPTSLLPPAPTGTDRGAPTAHRVAPALHWCYREPYTRPAAAAPSERGLRRGQP